MHGVLSGHLQGAGATVTGYCAIGGGSPQDDLNMPPAYHALSDHGSLVTEIQNHDHD